MFARVLDVTCIFSYRIPSGPEKKMHFSHRNIVTFPTISYVKSQNPPIVKFPTNLITRLPFFPTMGFHCGKMRNLGSFIADKDLLVLGDTFLNWEGNCTFLFTKTHTFGDPLLLQKISTFLHLGNQCKSIDNRIKNVFITSWIKIVNYFIYLLNQLLETNHRPDEVWTFEKQHSQVSCKI